MFCQDLLSLVWQNLFKWKQHDSPQIRRPASSEAGFSARLLLAAIFIQAEWSEGGSTHRLCVHFLPPPPTLPSPSPPPPPPCVLYIRPPHGYIKTYETRSQLSFHASFIFPHLPVLLTETRNPIRPFKIAGLCDSPV